VSTYFKSKTLRSKRFANGHHVTSWTQLKWTCQKAAGRPYSISNISWTLSSVVVIGPSLYFYSCIIVQLTTSPTPFVFNVLPPLNCFCSLLSPFLSRVKQSSSCFLWCGGISASSPMDNISSCSAQYNLMAFGVQKGNDRLKNANKIIPTSRLERLTSSCDNVIAWQSRY